MTNENKWKLKLCSSPVFMALKFSFRSFPIVRSDNLLAQLVSGRKSKKTPNQNGSKRGRKSKIKTQNGSKTTQKPRRDDNEQVTYDLTVLFSLIFVLNLWDWVTCGETRRNRLKFHRDTKKGTHKTSGQFISIYFSLFSRISGPYFIPL